MSCPVFPEPSWFQHCFSQAPHEVPKDLQQLSEKICRQYQMQGVEDPLNVANAVAVELSRGNGQNVFYEEPQPQQCGLPELVAKRIVERLANKIFEAPQKPCYLEVFESFLTVLQIRAPETSPNKVGVAFANF
jgi:hypothetical protein